MPQEYDLIAIGDLVTDAFIRIKQASVHYIQEEKSEELCFTNGAKVPYEFVEIVPAVGNSANASVAAARLGLRSAFVGDIGNDDHGSDDLAQFQKEKVATEFVTVHDGARSNYHYVLWFKAERTILIKHEEYARKFPNIGDPKWMYFSSLGEDSLSYHAEIAEYLKAHPGIKLAFQPGTFQIKFGTEQLKYFYERSEVFICNKEEAELILRVENIEAPELAKKMSELGPKISVITDGPKGAYFYTKETDETWFMPPYPDPKDPYERTGAGDAFSSTFVCALILGKTFEEAMLWAPVNSMSVVQKIGAQAGLLGKEEIEEWLKKAPEDYKPRRI